LRPAGAIVRKHPTQKKGWWNVAEHLPSKREALRSSPPVLPKKPATKEQKHYYSFVHQICILMILPIRGETGPI
jgi:hypothetical protein